MKTVNIEVTFLGNTTPYEFTEAQVAEITGLTNRAVALMALRQAFISAGSGIVKERFLKDHPKPEGVKLKEFLEKFSDSDVKNAYFPTASEVWQEALKKAEKAWVREAGTGGVEKAKKEAKAQLIAGAKAMLGYGMPMEAVLSAFPALTQADLLEPKEEAGKGEETPIDEAAETGEDDGEGVEDDALTDEEVEH